MIQIMIGQAFLILGIILVIGGLGDELNKKIELEKGYKTSTLESNWYDSKGQKKTIIYLTMTKEEDKNKRYEINTKFPFEIKELPPKDSRVNP